MELFTIDRTNSNRREAIIENYESFIWTDRYSAFGDVTIIVDPNSDVVPRLTAGKWLGMDESDRVMVIKTVLKERDRQKVPKLTIKGTSLEAKLMDRAAKKTFTESPWAIGGSQGAMIRNVVNDICVEGGGAGGTADIIPNLTATDLTGIVGSKKIKIKDGSLYDFVKNTADAYGLGFRIRVVPGNPTLYFEVYNGVNRSGINGVSFSEELDNLSDTSYLKSDEGYKNVAYVIAKNGSRVVYATGASGVTGFNRNVLLVMATDIDTVAGATLQDELLERGQQALGEHKKISLFDGTVNPDVTFRYKRDYGLGDQVVYRGDDKVRQVMTVTEHIWSADSNGVKSYPTLTNIGGV